MEFFPFSRDVDGFHIKVAAIFLHNIFATDKQQFLD
jgi:hypothetical protein